MRAPWSRAGKGEGREDQKKQLRKWMVACSASYRIRHRCWGAMGSVYLRVLAHGQSGRVLNTVREAQKERKARQVLARVRVYSKSEKNVP